MLSSLRAKGAGPIHSRIGPALFVVLGLGLSACHSYVPLVGVGPSPGDALRLRLSNAKSVEISERVGSPLRSVEGTLVRVRGDSLEVDISWGAVFVGTVFEGRRDTLSFRSPDILELDRREFSRTRTGLLLGSIAAVIVMIVRSISGGGDPGQPGDPDPNPF